MNPIFKIDREESNILIQKKEQTLYIKKSPDNDIWFNTPNNSLDLDICFDTETQEEWQSYIIFTNLMKGIIGRYILNGDYNDPYTLLPEDFIDIEHKTITWYSDNDSNNELQLKFSNRNINISINRMKKTTKPSNNTKVRIRTNGSSYGSYYQEFERFYQELLRFTYQKNAKKDQINLVEEAIPSKRKKLSIFDKFKK